MESCPRLGTTVDVVGVDDAGRLLLTETKPPDHLKGITWAPRRSSCTQPCSDR